MCDELKSIEEYSNPPVSEVAISLQFEPLSKFDSRHVGLLWELYRSQNLTNFEEHPLLDQTFELFGAEKVIPQIEFSNKPPLPRIWFINEEGTELIQVQKDRFVFNWRRKEPMGEYPRYKSCRVRFLELYQLFNEFLQKHQVGDLKPNQCEITYVNPIYAEDQWGNFSRLDKIFCPYQSLKNRSFLPDPDDISMALKYTIHQDGKPQGRLYVSIQPVLSLDFRKVFLLKLIARGKPVEDNIDGAMKFFDMGRLWIVKGFTALTTDIMHKKWGYENDAPNAV